MEAPDTKKSQGWAIEPVVYHSDKGNESKEKAGKRETKTEKGFTAGKEDPMGSKKTGENEEAPKNEKLNWVACRTRGKHRKHAVGGGSPRSRRPRKNRPNQRRN